MERKQGYHGVGRSCSSVARGRELLVAFFGVGPVAGIGPFAESGLDEAFGFAVGARGIGTSEAVANAELSAAVAELVGAIVRRIWKGALEFVGERFSP